MRKRAVELNAAGRACRIETRRVVDRNHAGQFGPDLMAVFADRNDRAARVVRHPVRFVPSEPGLRDANAPAFGVGAEFEVKDHGLRPTTTRSKPLRSRTIAPRSPEDSSRPTT